MPENIEEGLIKFFEYMWGDEQGWVYLPTINKGRQLTKYMFEWPRQKRGVVKHVVAQDKLENDVFYGPSLYKSAHPEQDNVLGTYVFWTDFDGRAPESWPETAQAASIPEPSCRIASSVPGREHAYWRLAKFETNIEQINSRNRALAYTLGADTGGWDANQFLRPPFTHNYGWNNKGEHKEWFNGEPAYVHIVSLSEDKLNPNTFNPLGTPEHIVSQKIDLGPLPPLSEVFMSCRWPDDFKQLFLSSKEEAHDGSPGGRSGSLARLGYFGAENGFSDEQIYVMLLDADTRWEKYLNRHDREKRLIDIIARARAKIGYVNLEELSFDGLTGVASNKVVTDSKLVYSFKELLELDVKVDWMMEGLLRNEGIGIFVGPPNVGKTQLLIQAGACAALGWDFLGWKNLSSPKKVLFFSLEMGTVPLKVFWEKISSEYADQIEHLAQNFNIMPLGEGIPLEQPRGQQLFDSVLTEYQPDLVIVDSLQKVTAKELSDETSIKAMLEYLDSMRLKHHTAMIFVHHNRKKPSDGASAVVDVDDMYGSRYIGANIEFALDLREIAKDIVAITHVKNRLGEKCHRFEIRRSKNLQYTLANETPSLDGLIYGANTRVLAESRPRNGGTSGGLLDFT